MGLAIFLLVVVFVFLPFNVVAVRQLVRLHPRRRRLVYAGAILGNLMWLFLPLLNQRTQFMRVIRAVLGPPWFAWLAFAAMYTAVIAILLIAWVPFRKRATFEQFARRPSRLFLWFIVIGSVVGFYQAIVPLRVERVRVLLKDLPPELGGTKLVLISDLHTGLFTRSSRLKRIFGIAAGERASAILLAGDLIDDDPYYTPKLLAATTGVTQPMIATLGNHEIYGGPFEQIAALRGTRVKLLVNEGVDLGGLWIAGLSDYAARRGPKPLIPDIDAALRGKPAGAFPIVVAHQPAAFADARKRGLPLTLVGHTHGGQLGFRPLHITLAGLFLPYDMGLYEKDGAQLYVTTGAGYWLLPFRLGMSPEIVVIELQPGEPDRAAPRS
jgi:predicted MPP superfamily phosphohydrolase